MNDSEFNARLLNGGVLVENPAPLSISLAYNQYTTARVTLLDSGGNPTTNNPYYNLNWVNTTTSNLTITPASDNLSCQVQQRSDVQIAGTYDFHFYMSPNQSGSDLGLKQIDQLVNVTITSEPPLQDGAAVSFNMAFDAPKTIGT